MERGLDLHFLLRLVHHPPLLGHADEGGGTPVEHDSPGKAQADEGHEQGHEPVEEGHLGVVGGTQTLLEPGEKANWELAPNKYSDWGELKVPADAIFTVTVIGLEDADGKSTYGDAEFSERDADRLNQLRDKYLSK